MNMGETKAWCNIFPDYNFYVCNRFSFRTLVRFDNSIINFLYYHENGFSMCFVLTFSIHFKQITDIFFQLVVCNRDFLGYITFGLEVMEW